MTDSVSLATVRFMTYPALCFRSVFRRKMVTVGMLALTLSLILCITGCRSGNPFQRSTPTTPTDAPIISTQATVSEVILLVNQHVSRVQSFSTRNATLDGEGIFNLKGEIAFQRPNNFRLIGSHAVTGTELDVGRNPDVMWMWIGKAEPKAMYFCRNADYAACETNLNLSINPLWVIDAMGFGQLDPNMPYEGPAPIDDRHIELRVRETTSSGETQTKIVVINRDYALPAAIRIYDRLDQLIADARVKSYRKDPETGIVIPQSIAINCPKENQGKGMRFTINYGTPELNRLDANNAHLWKMPAYQGYPPVNMAQGH
ncbi:MAG: hypothetical protein Q4C70_07245 [Planctomycetia bacterium]|nr:hypothetical protein [Planctomycetia bacterium]